MQTDSCGKENKWITIVAASVLGIKGRTNFKRLVAWALGVSPAFVRTG